MAGVITIGYVSGYVSRGGGVFGSSAPIASTLALSTPAVRHLTLKDMQVYADNTVFTQEDPEFCDADESSQSPQNGFCPGADNSGEGGGNYTGGKWFFTVNGQVYPTISLSSTGEVWRITHASGSRSYALTIIDDATGQPRPFQILAIDGVTINGSVGSQALARAAGGKFVPATCNFSTSGITAQPICATSLRMMPSSRIEIYVPTSPQGGSATLLTRVYSTGGDDWPSANLAHIDLSAGLSRPTMGLNLKGSANSLLTSTGILGAPVQIDGPHNVGGISLQNVPKLLAKLPVSEATILRDHVTSLSAPPDVPSAPCAALPPGHHRRIFFGVPKGDPDAFGLGYEEVDQHGRTVPGTFRDITEFDHSVIDVCLPLAKGNNAVSEPWELINTHDEDHNFHIHQTKFRVAVSSSSGAAGALVDNIPVLHGNGDCDGSVDNWRSGACHVQPVALSIPFSQVGDFVYHCHILEHEDGGMMAHIRVVPNP